MKGPAVWALCFAFALIGGLLVTPTTARAEPPEQPIMAPGQQWGFRLWVGNSHHRHRRSYSPYHYSPGYNYSGHHHRSYRRYVRYHYYSGSYYRPFAGPVVVYDTDPGVVAVASGPISTGSEDLAVSASNGMPALYQRDLPTSFMVHVAAQGVPQVVLSHETVDGEVLFGFGMGLRHELVDWFGFELATDFLYNRREGYEHFAAPITASGLFHFLGDELVDPYLLVGTGLIINNVEDRALDGVERYLQFVGQAGAGIEIRLGEMVLTTDLRFLLAEVRPDRPERVAANVIADDPDVTVRDLNQIAPTIDTPVAPLGEPDDFTGAWQLSIGVGWRF